MIKEIFYNVEKHEDNVTVENFLRFRGYSRAMILTLKKIPDGLTVDGKLVFTIHRLHKGQTLRVKLVEMEKPSNICPADCNIKIVYEDEDIFVVDKPYDMAVHPSKGNQDPSLANAIAKIYKQRDEIFVFRCIGRLDRDTSGLVVLAKHALSAAILSKKGAITRTYLAVTNGVLDDSGIIEQPIAKSETSLMIREVREDGDYAKTKYITVHKNENFSIAAVKIYTGRTHQIRVHMKHIGHTLVGDTLYNASDSSHIRHLLHAARITVIHPLSGEVLTFSSDIPQDMRDFIGEDVSEKLDTMKITDLFENNI